MRRTQCLISVHIILCLSLLILTTSCAEKISQLIRSVDEVPSIRQNSVRLDQGTCNSPASYQPDPEHPEHTPMKFLRVNVHFMNSADSSSNYNMGKAEPFARELIDASNYYLGKNHKMALPAENETPVLPTRYRYVLTPSEGYENDQGIYCHYDDQLFAFVTKGRARNTYNRDVIKHFGIGLDSIINIFIMPHHPDSVKSRTYNVTEAGVALGSGVKITGLFETGKPAGAYRGLVNHEIGHVLGLRHTWSSNDGCTDTPKHPNCWNTTDEPPCDSLASNNVMDYNAHQFAYTPCQIGKIHANISRASGRARKLAIPNWCSLDESKTIYISDSVTWTGAKDLEGNLVIEDGGYLRVQCRLSIPKGGTITVAPKGTLELFEAHLHNDCAETWQGIQVKRRGSSVGTVINLAGNVIENVSQSNDLENRPLGS